MNFHDLLKQVEKIDPVKAFQNLVNDNPTIFIDLLKKQLSEGRRGDGFIDPEYRSIAYGNEKQSRGSKAPPGVPELLDTGDFYKGITLSTSFTADNVELTFYSTDSKADALTNKYTVAIWTYDNETIDEVIKFIEANYIDYLFE